MRILLGGNALNLNEGGVGASVALAALVAEQAALRVESTRREWSCKPSCSWIWDQMKQKSKVSPWGAALERSVIRPSLPPSIILPTYLAHL